MGCSFSKCNDKDISCAATTTNSHTNISNDNEVNLTHFKVSSVTLGIGGFGIVRSAKKMHGEDFGKQYALKTMNKSALLKRTSGPNCVMTELHALTKLTECNYICSVHYAFQDDSYLYLALDIAEGGDLRYNLRSQPQSRFPESIAKLYICQVLIALEYCHGVSILHRDVKPENILMCKSGYLKLTDFGVAKILPNIEDCRSTSGTHGYMAPEIYMASHVHGISADWFATGVTLHELLTGRRPFEVFKLQSYKSRCPEPLTLEFLDYSCNFISMECKDFIHKLLSTKACNRLGSTGGLIQIAKHPWLSDVNWPGLNAQSITPPCRPDLSYTRTDINSEDMKRMTQQNLLAEPLSEKEQKLFKGFEYRNKIFHEVTTTTARETSTDANGNARTVTAQSFSKENATSLHKQKRLCHAMKVNHRVTGENVELRLSECDDNVSEDDEPLSPLMKNTTKIALVSRTSPPRKRRLKTESAIIEDISESL